MKRQKKGQPDHDNSSFIRHVPCGACGSRDNNAEYTDGHTYCFGCGAHTSDDQAVGTDAGGDLPANRERTAKRPTGLLEVEVRGIRSRGITDATATKFGYGWSTRAGKKVQVAPYYGESGDVLAQKIRGANKEFTWAGDAKANLFPFGSQAWAHTGKMITVTEGEIDALAMSQVQDNKWPVVSIPCGAGPQIKKYFAQNLEYFKGFEKIVLMFDNDEPGRKAAVDAAEVIGPRAHIATLPLKDACDMLQAGRVKEMIDAMWRAKKYQPAGIVTLESLKDIVLKGVKQGIPWHLPALTAATFGRRTGELYAFGAGTGVGKSDFFAESIVQTVMELNLPVGVFSLEQHPRETALRIAGKVGSKAFHVPDGSWTQEELEASWDTLTGAGKIFLYDSFGMNEWEIIADRMRYLRHAEGVEHFYLDHLTALASGADERVELEEIMSSLGSIVKELDVCIYFISHLNTPEGKPHEEGGRVTIRNFKGSRSIGFWSHFMFGMERNTQAEDLEERSMTTLRVLKDRYTGRATGVTIPLEYDHATCRMKECDRSMYVDESSL